jgi:hypothetical protein
MCTTKRGLSFAVCAGVGGFIAYAIVGAGPLRAMSPCMPSTPVTLTGTLIDVRQGDAIVPNEQAILEGLPRRACVSPTNQGTPDGGAVTVSDCDFPEYAVKATLVP